jgi:predicted anti-sigma-YlaC factor YlaD
MKQTFRERMRMAFVFWLARRLPDCKTITPLIGESIDRKISLREKIVIKLHLFTCEACKRYLYQIRLMRDAVKMQESRRDGGEIRRDKTLSLEAKERMRRAVENAGS